MSAYNLDPRVAGTRTGLSFKVDQSERGWKETGLVWLRGDGRWVACRERGSYVLHETADEAIRSLIGGPR